MATALQYFVRDDEKLPYVIVVKQHLSRFRQFHRAAKKKPGKLLWPLPKARRHSESLSLFAKNL